LHKPPRAEQAQKRLFLGIESNVASANNAQMPRPEILERPAGKILLNDSRGDLRPGATEGVSPGFAPTILITSATTHFASILALNSSPMKLPM
jgi:hypothetical protein